MRDTLSRLFYFLGFIFAVTACATPSPPPGGPRDKQPPQIDLEQSTPNEQTNFSETSFEITFDEWVQLDNPLAKVVVSPPLAYTPSIDLRGKTLRFRFHPDEVLRENATYTVNFGESVKDVTERNPAEDLRFVFSTGDEIDSLKIQGSIVDAFTGEPVKDAYFMLYDVLDDSVVTKSMPFYFAKTDKAGTFEIQNIRADTFKAFALSDGNLNYKYDPPTEAIGFPDQPVIVSADTVLNIAIRMSLPDQTPKVQGYEAAAYTRVSFGFGSKIDSLPDYQLNPEIEHWTDQKDDSLLINFLALPPKTWEFYVNRDTLTDTLEVRMPDSAKVFGKLEVQLVKSQQTDKYPKRPLSIQFTQSLKSINPNKLDILEDTTNVSPDQFNLRIDPDKPDRIIFEDGFKNNKRYSFNFLPGALQPVLPVKPNDTLEVKISAKSPSDFGIINLSVKNLDSASHYVFQLENGNTDILVSDRASGQTSWTREYKNTLPGQYFLRIILDQNKNGKWDPGEYATRRQPEVFTLEKLEQLRADWTLELEINLNMPSTN